MVASLQVTVVRAAFGLIHRARPLSLGSLLLSASTFAVVVLFVLANALQVAVSPDSHVLSPINLPPGLGDFAAPQPVQQGHLVDLD